MNKLFTLILFLNFAGFASHAHADPVKKPAINLKPACPMTALMRSHRSIQFILNDLTTTYTEPGGGGISKIKAIATNTYVIFISQEERVDQISYSLDIDKACNITVLKREVSALSPWDRK